MTVWYIEASVYYCISI